MKSIYLLVIFLAAPAYVVLYPADGEGIFLNKYKVDVDHILGSKRLFMSYANCILDKGGCTEEGKTLKEQIPVAMKTECAKCSAEEKKQIAKILSYILQNHRELWNEIMDKFDADGSFRKKYEVEDDEEEP